MHLPAFFLKSVHKLLQMVRGGHSIKKPKNPALKKVVNDWHENLSSGILRGECFL